MSLRVPPRAAASPNTIKTVIETINRMARRNTPEIRTGCLYYKPSMNKTDIVPNYFLHETAAWLVFPHELEGLSHEEMQKKWDPAISTVRTNPTRIEFQPSAWFPPPAIVPTATTHNRLLVVWERSVAVGVVAFVVRPLPWDVCSTLEPEACP